MRGEIALQYSWRLEYPTTHNEKNHEREDKEGKRTSRSRPTRSKTHM